MKYWIALSVSLLLITGCGRKELPQPVLSSGAPTIESLQIEVTESSTELKFKLTGGEEGVGFHIDRAEIDPFCNCPAFWNRFYDEYPLASNSGREFSKLLRNEMGKHRYVYRIRAVDGSGRLAPWSEVIWPKEKAGSAD